MSTTIAAKKPPPRSCDISGGLGGWFKQTWEKATGNLTNKKEVVKEAEEAEADSIGDKPFVAGGLLAILDLSDFMLFPYLGDFFLSHESSISMVGLCFVTMSLSMVLGCVLMPCIMKKVGGSAMALGLGMLGNGFLRALVGILELLPNGTPMSSTAVVLFGIIGFLYAFTEVGALSWILFDAPPGKKTAALAGMLATRNAGAMLVRLPPPFRRTITTR